VKEIESGRIVAGSAIPTFV